jgi:hypothetical protein
VFSQPFEMCGHTIGTNYIKTAMTVWKGFRRRIVLFRRAAIMSYQLERAAVMNWIRHLIGDKRLLMHMTPQKQFPDLMEVGGRIRTFCSKRIPEFLIPRREIISSKRVQCQKDETAKAIFTRERAKTRANFISSHVQRSGYTSRRSSYGATSPCSMNRLSNLRYIAQQKHETW